MANKRRIPAAMAILLCGFSGDLYSHHGVAAYDRTSAISIDATITGFEWENPHALIRFESAVETGLTQEWVVETAGLIILARAGWNKETFKPGDFCTVIGYPARNGSRTMILQSVVLADGRELSNYIP